MARAQILVADSDPGFAGGLAANLESLGYGVTQVVSSPEEALQKVEETRPDLVLLDLGWLRDGQKGKAAQQLRKRFPQGLLYLVPDEERETLRQAQVTHSFDYLRKTYDSRELETIIGIALYRQKLEGELRRGEEVRRVESKRAGLELQRINRALRTLSAGNKALVRAQTEAELLQDVCRAVVEEGGYRLAWIGYGESDREKTVLPMAQAGYEEGYLETLKITWADTERGRGPTGTAIRTGQSATARNMLIDPLFAPWRQEALKRGYASSLVLPLMLEDTAFGALSIYAGEADAFDAAEVQLLTDLAADVSFGTMALRAREERRQMAAALRRSYDELEARVQDRTQDLAQSNAALQTEVAERLWSEKKLRESEERYRSLVDLSPDAIAVQSQGRYLFINPAGARLFGAADPRDLVGKVVADVTHPDYRQLVSERICQVNAPGDRTELQEIRILRLDGRVVDVEASGVGITYQGQPAVLVMLRDITARKEMERNLEHQASFPRLNPNPVLEADSSGNITYANAATLQALEKLGMGQETRAFLPPDLDEIRKAAAETGETVFSRDVELGDAVFAETISFLLELQVIRIYARDITRQKRAEIERQEVLEKLQISEEELQVINEELQAQTEELQAANQSLNEAHAALGEGQKDLNWAQAVAHTGSWRLDVRKNELLWSDETYRIFGIPQGTSLTYEEFLAMVHPEDREYVDQEWTAAMRGRPYDIEHRIVVGDRVKWVRELSELEFDAQGQLLGGFGTVQDITERKQAEEALQESEARYRTLFQNNHAVMLLIDPESGEIVDGNPAACSFYGYSQKELTAKKITDLNLAPRDGVFQEMRRVRAGEESHFFFKHSLADGEVRDVEVYSSPLEVRGRMLLYSIIHDNSARKEAEETLQASRDFLEIANRHNRMDPLLQDYAVAVKEHTGCEAVAIRILDEQGKIPYEAYAGFQEEFIACESPLSIMSDHCLCINVIKGETDPALPCYTPGASCCINRFSHLLATTPPGLLGETRNVCHRFGYESVALVPIVFGGSILGLIHLADRRENMVPLSLVERLERIALTLGMAINRVRAEEERQRLIRELETERARLQAIIASAPEAIVVADANGLVLMTNPAADRLYSHPEGCVQDASSCALFQFYQTDGAICAPGDQPLLRSAKGGETHRNVEMVLAWPDGQCRDLLVNTAPIKDHQGRSSGAVGLFQDITSLKEAEKESRRLAQELEEQRALLEAVLHQMPAGLVIMSAAGKLILANEQVEAIFRQPVPPDSGVEQLAEFKTLRADGRPCHLEEYPLIRALQQGETIIDEDIDFQRGDGSRSILRCSAAPVRDRHGDVMAGVVTFYDITERKQAELELARSRAEFEAIFNAIADAIVFTDTQRRVMMVNPAVTTMLGYDPQEICGQNISLIYAHEADYQKMGRKQYHTGAPPEGQIFQVPYRRKDGKVFIGETMGTQVRDASGQVVGFVGIYRDITQRKEVEDKIRKLNLELSDRIREVSERTLQLEAANKELEAFSYSVSHDLRTPLRAIDGFARILLEDYEEKLDEEGLRLLEVIRGNTRIMAELIDDLLALSRLGRQEIRAQEIDVGGLVTSVFGELKTQEPARQMELILNPLPQAFGDRSLINQVLVNLLGNAVKFTKSREKAIIEAGGWTEGKEYIYFIKDNGVGFDMRYVEKIFGVFQRLHRREDFEGMGVGLAIVQRIINRHGGRVWATGKVDHGAEFFFTLPRKGEVS